MLSALFGTSVAQNTAPSTPSEDPTWTVASSSSSTPASSSPPTSPTPSLPPPFEPLEVSGYFRRLKARNIHGETRIREIRAAGLADLPPVEPPQWACCNSSCGLGCVVTVWWEEEKTWRECHENWKDIKEQLKADEEELQREREEAEALAGPSLSIEVGIAKGEDSEALPISHKADLVAAVKELNL